MQVCHYQAPDIQRGAVSVPSHIHDRFELDWLSGLTSERAEATTWGQGLLRSWVQEVVDTVAGLLGPFTGSVHLVPARKPPAWAPISESDWTTGYSPNPDVWLSVPPNPSELHFKSVLAHELHHSLTPMPKRGTVGNWLKVEGLAEAFALHLYPQERWHWSLFPECDERPYKVKMLRNLGANDFFLVQWLLNGDPEDGVPHFAGYTYGYRAVNRYRQAHPKTTWAQLAKVPAYRLLTA